MLLALAVEVVVVVATIATVVVVVVVVVVAAAAAAAFSLLDTNIGCQTVKSKRLPQGAWFELGVHLLDRVPPGLKLKNFWIIRDQTDFPFFFTRDQEMGPCQTLTTRAS